MSSQNITFALVSRFAMASCPPVNSIFTYQLFNRRPMPCKDLRSQLQKSNIKKQKAERRKKAKEQGPKSIGDMVVKGEDKEGRLRYAWNDIEVLVTPREKREPVDKTARKDVIARANESTQERAFRKMKEKVKRILTKAAKGECEKITARDLPSNAVGPTQDRTDEDASWPTHMSPALALLDDPTMLANLRTSFEFLDTLRMHQCENCNEQWPVFDGTWPQDGVATAGDKAVGIS